MLAINRRGGGELLLLSDSVLANCQAKMSP